MAKLQDGAFGRVAAGLKRPGAGWLFGLMVMWGCGGGAQPAAEQGSPASPETKPEAKPAATPAPKPEPADEKPAAELTATATDPSFQLSLKPAGPYEAGKLGTFVVDLEPRGEYHVNEEYPMSVTVSAGEGMTLPKAELKKADAAEFGQKRARFEVPFTPTAKGEHRVEAHVRFAVCTPETCVPDERKLALALPVE